LQKIAPTAEAASSSFNSQTVPLLTSPINPDPTLTLGGDIAMANDDALLPQDNPLGNGDTESRPVNSQISVYVVRDGDTLSSIAELFQVSVSTIVGANDIKGGIIHEGQQLIILPITGIEHTVKKGDTLASLATKFNSDATDIATYNNLSGDEDLVVGQTIIIPNGETPATPTSSATPATPKKSSSIVSKIKSKVAKAVASVAGFVPIPLRGAGGPDLGNYYAWPLDGGIITQSLHGFDAVDIGAPTGTSIYAAAAGTVIVAKDDGAWNGGYGNYIVIQHDNGTQTLYAHASRILVTEGETVAQGDTIAKVGETGEATGPHLHFEVRGAKNPFGDIPVGDGDD
jgi:LysM repeat protein